MIKLDGPSHGPQAGGKPGHLPARRDDEAVAADADTWQEAEFGLAQLRSSPFSE